MWDGRCEDVRAVVRLRGGREMRLIQSASPGRPVLRQFGHRKLHVPAVVGYVATGGVELGVFKTVTAHLGVLVVDRVDEEEDDGDGDYCDRHESSYEGKVVLCQEINTRTSKQTHTRTASIK